MHHRLYVGNLAGDVAASTLQELFEPHGFVMDVKLVTGSRVGRALGFAFVTMATDESAGAAMSELHQTSLHGVVIKVEAARADRAVGPAREAATPR
jgi:RNA recognition motif-containing protein